MAYDKIIINDIISETIECLDKAFNGEVTIESIPFDEMKSFLNDNTQDAFTVTLENGLYVNNPDFDYSCTRMYSTIDDIAKGNTYIIKQRTGDTLHMQNKSLIDAISAQEKPVVIIDEGIFL